MPEEQIMDSSAFKLADSLTKITQESLANIINIQTTAQTAQVDEPDVALEKETAVECIVNMLKEGEENFQELPGQEDPSSTDPLTKRDCILWPELHAKDFSLDFPDSLGLSHGILNTEPSMSSEAYSNLGVQDVDELLCQAEVDRLHSLLEDDSLAINTDIHPGSCQPSGT